ncbi:hypothetical protein AGMMS49574_01880 [Bacteroidia bacterium]|nr:hypothetical protein AGMMS49574_01880 [Bacteroidia bacterium]
MDFGLQIKEIEVLNSLIIDIMSDKADKFREGTEKVKERMTPPPPPLPPPPAPSDRPDPQLGYDGR